MKASGACTYNKGQTSAKSSEFSKHSGEGNSTGRQTYLVRLEYRYTLGIKNELKISRGKAMSGP